MESDLDEALNEALMLVSMVHDALSATQTLVRTGAAKALDAEGCAGELSDLLMCIARVAQEAQSAVFEVAMTSPNSCKAALVAA